MINENLDVEGQELDREKLLIFLLFLGILIYEVEVETMHERLKATRKKL